MRFAALGALVLLSGCSLLLDFSEEGLPCNEAGECLEGYTCDRDNLCMPDGAPSTLCEPKCGLFDRCVKAKCQPLCKSPSGETRGCAAGQYCDPIQGSCVAVPASTRSYGVPCSTDGDCSEAGSEARCLRPYGGGDGFCTKECAADAECGGKANKCTELVAGKGVAKVCAPESFKPCTRESDCTTSGLSCGAYAFGAPKTLTVVACRARLDGAAIGEKCNSVIKCSNGLCLPVSGTDFACTTPCKTPGDCAETAPAGKAQEASCQELTLSPPASSALPKVRPQLCMYAPISIAFACQTSGTCTADAPQCVDFKTGATTVSQCAPACGDDPNDTCPTGTKCRPADGGTAGQFCGPPN